MKTHPHNIEQARAEIQDRRAAAGRLPPDYSPAWFAAYNVLSLQDIADRGLPSCSDGMGLAWQCDFWADLPWTDPERDQTIQLMLADPRFEAIRAALLSEYGLDLAEELRRGLAEIGGAR
jgi:hypothetical protein